MMNDVVDLPVFNFFVLSFFPSFLSIFIFHSFIPIKSNARVVWSTPSGSVQCVHKTMDDYRYQSILGRKHTDLLDRIYPHSCCRRV
mmetsp:Transcript_18180/g.18376  ORF Transcript_18180/g.18376 Transcript_18180/m.18376 type:complete len:86 (-) Transcript_18180:403-660(-)